METAKNKGQENKAAILSSLTFFLGQLETLRADLNDIIRFTKQNAWENSDEKADSGKESKKDAAETAQ